MPDPSVSPADTIRRIEELREKAARRGRIDHEEGARFATADWDDVLFLLAVGERDRQHIARLTKVGRAALIVADLNGEMRSTYGRAVSSQEWNTALWNLETLAFAARAVLADKEDTGHE